MTFDHFVREMLWQAGNSTAIGNHQSAENIFWRLIAHFQSPEISAKKLELIVLDRLADSCEAQAKYEDAEFIRKHRLFLQDSDKFDMVG
jgi:hypothetical protein